LFKPEEKSIKMRKNDFAERYVTIEEFEAFLRLNGEQRPMVKKSR